MVDDGTRGEHSSDPAEGSRDQGEEAEARVAAQTGQDQDDEDTDTD